MIFLKHITYSFKYKYKIVVETFQRHYTVNTKVQIIGCDLYINKQQSLSMMDRLPSVRVASNSFDYSLVRTRALNFTRFALKLLHNQIASLVSD